MNYILIFLIYVFLSYGLTNLLVNGKGPFNVIGWFRMIMGSISREFHSMLSCMMCTSTNVGLILSVIDLCYSDIIFTPFNYVFNGEYILLTIIFDMAITSGIVWFLHNIELYFETNIKYDDDE